MNRCDYVDPALVWTGVKDTGRGQALSQLGFDPFTRLKSFHLKLVVSRCATQARMGTTMADPSDRSSLTCLQPVFAEIAGRDDVDPVVRPSDRADAQVNGALPLAKQIGANPREIAQRVVDSGVLDGVCSTLEIAGPGFINLTFDDDFLAAELGRGRRRRPARCAGSVAGAQGRRRLLGAERRQGDARRPPAHHGHRRRAGADAEFLGHDVIRENHIGDWGRPFGMLIEHLLDIGEDVAAEGMAQGDLDGFYKAANAKFNEDPAFQERSRERVVKLQSYDPDTIAIWKRLVAMSNDYFNRVYRELGVLLTDDDLAGESKYQALMPEVYDAARRGRSARGQRRRQGRVPARVPQPRERTAAADRPLAQPARSCTRPAIWPASSIASSGSAPTCCCTWSVRRRRSTSRWCSRWRAWPAGCVRRRRPCTSPFGSVLGEDRKMLRSRSGDAVKLIELLDEAIERAGAAVAEKNPDLDAATRAEVARMIGIGAVKYADLSTDRIKDYVFDWDRMLAFDGNTAPYLQYAHARICSIFRRAGVDRATVRGSAITLGADQERALAKRLLGYPTALAETIATYSPHKLCDLPVRPGAGLHRLLRALPGDAAPTSRCAPAGWRCATSPRARCEHGLGLLGIEAPESM